MNRKPCMQMVAGAWITAVFYSVLHTDNTRESQNHRTVEVGRDLQWSSDPTPLLKQGHLQPLAQDQFQMVFEYLQPWRLHKLSGQPVPVLGHPHSKMCFLMFRQSLSCFSLCPLPLVLSLHTTEKNLALSPLHPTFRYFIHG